MSDSGSFIPALRFHALTSFFDVVVRWTCREGVWKSKLISFAGLRGGFRVLDVGCGTGTLAVQLKTAHPDVEVVGVDADEHILKLARLKAAKLDVTFDRCSAISLPYRDSSFDVVFSSLTFHHLTTEDKTAACREILRVLKPKGRFLIADWGAPRNLLMRLLFFGIQLLDGFTTTRDHVNGRLPRILSDAGFVTVAKADEYQTVFGSLWILNATK
eukprot:TRINITY_DN19102_c0_g1_i1.p1 TRINITY_DN19102_c0_g1~~TRINITY_DN19102_c0_g1_i1.p1  ORF type:complete len:215 (-),score=5.60 TRINITY_DN19102_c0_g1_i1:241-885(-)